MKLAGKEFDYYWKIMKVPLIVLVVWALLGFFISLASYAAYQTIFSNIAGTILIVVIFGFVGWTTVKDHKGTVKMGAWAGVLTGLIYGFIGGIIGILMINLVPDIVTAALASAAAQGASAEMVQSYIKIAAYIGLIIGPIINAIVGAAISAIGALIAKKV